MGKLIIEAIGLCTGIFAFLIFFWAVWAMTP